MPSNSRISAALLSEQRISEKEKERARSTKRKVKRKLKRKKLYKLYEKRQEEIVYQKAQLLVKAAQKRQLNCKIKKDHSYIINTIKFKNKMKESFENDHTYMEKRDVKSNINQKTQGGECSSEQTPARPQ